jgi:predicted DCC family thiol-disulfide oxidoreductase YuxK
MIYTDPMKSKKSERSPVQVASSGGVSMRQAREGRGVTLLEMQSRLDELLGNTPDASISTSVASIARYEKNEESAPEGFKRLYARALNLPANRFLAQQQFPGFNVQSDSSTPPKPLQEFARAFVPSHFLQDEEDILEATLSLLEQVEKQTSPKRITFVIHHPDNPVIQSAAILAKLVTLAETHFLETIWPDTGVYGDTPTTHALIRFIAALSATKNPVVFKHTKSQIGFDSLIIDDIGLIVLSTSIAEAAQEKIRQGWMVTLMGYEHALEFTTLQEHLQENTRMLKSKEAQFFISNLETKQLAHLQFSQPFSLYQSIRDLLVLICDPLLEYSNINSNETWLDLERKLVTFERKKTKTTFMVQPFLSTLTFPEAVLFDEKSFWTWRTSQKFGQANKEQIRNLAIFRSDRIAEFQKNIAKQDTYHLYSFATIETWVQSLEQQDNAQKAIAIDEAILRLQKLSELLERFPKFRIALIQDPKALERLGWVGEPYSKSSQWYVKEAATILEAALDRTQLQFVSSRVSNINDPGVSRILSDFFLDVWKSLPANEIETSQILVVISEWIARLKKVYG